MANYKDQGVKNHEIERLTPQLLKLFSLYDQWLLLFREVSSTHTYKHIQATAHQLFSFFSYIISLSYSPFILMTDHFLFYVYVHVHLCVDEQVWLKWEGINDICHWKSLRWMVKQILEGLRKYKTDRLWSKV